MFFISFIRLDHGHPERAFFQKRLGLGRHFGLKLLAKLAVLLWHCESLVHFKMFWFSGLKHMNPKLPTISQIVLVMITQREKSFGRYNSTILTKAI